VEIKIENCNNITKGSINIEKNKLNIKFGINGTGKSTIAKAIQYHIEDKDEDKLKTLLPFKLREENQENLSPKIEIKNEEIKSVSIFNEEYIKKFLFKKEELVSNSFEIFIKTPKYIETEKNIEEQLKEIKKIFLNNEELDQAISDFESLSKSFKTTQKGLSDASAISKGLKNGNKIDNIPKNLREYTPFIQNKEKCVSWLDWQIKGNEFSKNHNNCPYCVSPTDDKKKQTIKSVSENYDKNVIKNFIVIIKVIESLGDYFSKNSKEELEKILKKTDGLLEEEKTYIITIKSQADNFLERLKNLKNISFNNLKDDEKIEEKLTKFIIKIGESFDKLKSDKTEKIVSNINKSLTTTLEKIGKLKGDINKQKGGIKNSIKEHQKNINQFLKNAGYKYEVLIDDENKIKLRHIDYKNNILGGDQYLSFGEKNAFALVLFMYETLSKNSDLIILDDPISSFDKNKKYAILQMLFRDREDISFKGKTVLMLTHDIEPIIDSVKALSYKFKDQTNASLLQYKDENITEKEIKKENILTFTQICKNIIKDENINEISKLIYLRRDFEILDDKGDEYQILSNLFHKRTKKEAKEEAKRRNENLSDDDFETSFREGEKKLKKVISDFDYEEILKIIQDTEELKKIYKNTNNGYEKLQLFKIINGEFTKQDDFSDVMKKFINETYHIENDLIHQLNPRDYDLIPEFIVKECDRHIFQNEE